jgi:glutaredoxin 3
MRVEIYTKKGCPYSRGAKRLLDEKGITYDEIDVTDDAERRAEMERRSGGRTTVPQVFFGARHVGGYDDLQELDRTRGVRTLLVEDGESESAGA